MAISKQNLLTETGVIVTNKNSNQILPDPKDSYRISAPGSRTENYYSS